MGATPSPFNWLYPTTDLRSSSLLPIDQNTDPDSSGWPQLNQLDGGPSGPTGPITGLLSGRFPNTDAGNLIKVSTASAAPQVPINPYQTDVFKPDPDGKLRPVPGWRTTGPFDFEAWSHLINWPGVARDLTEIATSALQFVGLGEASPFLNALGPNVDSTTARAIQEAFDNHHPHSKFMGGRTDQELVQIPRLVHQELHQTLARELRAANFPPVGGRAGSTKDWLDYFGKYPARRDKAIGILKKVTQDIDQKHGTAITPALERELKIAQPAPATQQEPLIVKDQNLD